MKRFRQYLTSLGEKTITPQQSVPYQTGSPVLSTKAREALDHYNKALDYLKQDNWSDFGNELQQMKSVLLQMTETKTNLTPELK